MFTKLDANSGFWQIPFGLAYLMGKKFHIHTDHKPLVPLFSTKELPIRVQRFRLRMMRFDYTISHVPGKNLIIADTLSRAPSMDVTESNSLFQKEVDCFVDTVLDSLPATEKQLLHIRQHQQEDEVCQTVASYCQSGWPEKHRLSDEVQRHQPLIPSPLPDLPWQRVATDLYEWKQQMYVLVDYYSRYIEIARLTKATADEVILYTKSIFARHGIPEEAISDNGSQYTSAAYQKVCTRISVPSCY